MHELYWNYFSLTGNIEAFLLYRQSCPQTEEAPKEETWEEEAIDAWMSG